MTFNVEITEAEIRAAVASEVNRRVRERIPYNSDHIRTAADSMIRTVASDAVAELDVKELVRAAVRESFDKILHDTVRLQVKSIVRLAVHQEVAALKAEVQGGDDGRS